MKYLIMCAVLTSMVGCGGSNTDPFETAVKSPPAASGHNVPNPTDPFKDFISKR